MDRIIFEFTLDSCGSSMRADYRISRTRYCMHTKLIPDRMYRLIDIQ